MTIAFVWVSNVPQDVQMNDFAVTCSFGFPWIKIINLFLSQGYSYILHLLDSGFISL